MAAIEADGLRRSYGDVEALAGASFTVDAGELYGLLGPNGAGKTTAIRALTGQIVPDEGDALVLGIDPTAEPIETRRRVGILPEKQSPPSFLTPREYFSFVGRVRGLDPDLVTDRLETWADRLGFRDKLDTLATDLSRGQQQKVMIAQAFVHEPDLVFIDEPLANLDPIVQERVKRFLVSYADRGNAILVSTHDIDVAEEICTRVGIVADGRLVTERDVEEGADRSLLEVFVDEVDGTDAAASRSVRFEGPGAEEGDGTDAPPAEGDTTAESDATAGPS